MRKMVSAPGMKRAGVVLSGCAALVLAAGGACAQDLVVRGGVVHTVSGEPIENGVVVITDGMIVAVGPAGSVSVPGGYEVLEAAVVTPGLVDSRGILGLSGILNQDQDQDQLERSEPIQPGLRALDAYNPHDELIDWARSFGTTTAHTGHAPGELISGQTFIVKLHGNSADEAVVEPVTGVAATLATSARKSGGKSPGTRGKMVSMLRQALLDARAYQEKHAKFAAGDDGGGDAVRDDAASPAVDLEMDALVRVLEGELPLIVTANRAQDIATALRLKREFGIELWLDSAAEAYLFIDELKELDVPVLLHPPMSRAWSGGEMHHMSVTTAAQLADAGIAVTIQTGYEAYVPKTRVVLFEAAIAAANGLGPERALRAITLTPAEILGIADRVGSIEVGKDGDLALYDGDPFEYTSHCVGVVIEGEVVSRRRR